MDLGFLAAHRDGIILGLDLFGTAIFAITGALRGWRSRLDFLGVVVLACAVGVGGGITRDALIGATPVAAFQDGRYFIICALVGAIAFYVAPRLGDRWNVIPVLDAVGLGVFTAIGCEKAALYGCTWVAVVLCGVMTAVGGGVIRDVLAMRIPAVLRSDFYATAALIGGFLFGGVGRWARTRKGVWGEPCPPIPRQAKLLSVKNSGWASSQPSVIEFPMKTTSGAFSRSALASA